MNGTEELRQALAEWLTENGLTAVTAWSEAKRKRPGGAVAAVSLRGMESGPGGYQSYLGERYDETTMTWVERYGRRVELTFGLDLSAATAEEAQAGLDTLSALLSQQGPEGMAPVGFSAGETAYRQEAGRYVCPVQARFLVWAVAEIREDGSFLDFDVRGEKRT